MARCKVLVLGQTPPPYGGQALMIEQLVRADLPGVRTYHVRMGFSDSMSSLGRVSGRKLLHLPSIIGRTLALRFRHHITVLYYPPAGPTPAAVVRDMVLLSILRPFFRKVIFHFHAAGLSDFLKTRGRAFRRLAGVAYGRPDAAIQISARAAPDAEYFGSRNLVIIPNGLPDAAPQYLDSRRAVDGKVRVLFVGAISEIKGAMLLLEAVRELASRRSDFTVWFMGEFTSRTFESRVRDFCRKEGLEEVVAFLGLRVDDAKWQVFRDADLLCLPSFLESFGNVLVEAMMFRLPVVATPVGGIPDIVEPGVTGILLSRNDSGELAGALEQLIADPDRRERMGRAGRRRYLSLFTLEVHLQRMDAILSAVGSR